MLERPSRRTALKQIAAAGVAATITPITIRGQSAPIRIAGMPVEIAIASVSPVTVRITVAAIAGTGGVPDDGARREPHGALLGRSADDRGRDGQGRAGAAAGPRRRSTGHPVSAAEGTAAGSRRGRAAVRSEGFDRSDAERSRRVSAEDPRR